MKAMAGSILKVESLVGFGDKVVAEFITELGRCCSTVDGEFDTKLKDNGAEMADSLSGSKEGTVEPLLKMLLAGVNLGCSDEILTIIAMIQTGDIFYRPREKQGEADKKRGKLDKKRGKLFQPGGDHLTLFAVYEAWKAYNFSGVWCFQNFDLSRSLRRARDVRKQLLTIMDKYRLQVVSAGEDVTKIRKAITAGFFLLAARKEEGCYRTLVENRAVYIHPSSALFQCQPDWVIYHELVMTTTKEYMRQVTVVDPKWLVELAPTFFNPTRMSKRKRQERIEPLYDDHSYHEPNSWCAVE